jgi:hypothetical protein
VHSSEDASVPSGNKKHPCGALPIEEGLLLKPCHNMKVQNLYDMQETYLFSLIVSDFVSHMCDGGDDNKVGYSVILFYVSCSLFVIVFVYLFMCFGVFSFV